MLFLNVFPWTAWVDCRIWAQSQWPKRTDSFWVGTIVRRMKQMFGISWSFPPFATLQYLQVITTAGHSETLVTFHCVICISFFKPKECAKYNKISPSHIWHSFKQGGAVVSIVTAQLDGPNPHLNPGPEFRASLGEVCKWCVWPVQGVSLQHHTWPWKETTGRKIKECCNASAEECQCSRKLQLTQLLFKFISGFSTNGSTDVLVCLQNEILSNQRETHVN